MNEAETRAEHIDPALAVAGWGRVEGSRIRREYPITLGRLEGAGKRGKPLTADYVLEYRNTKLAVVEAKAWDKELTEGVGQAKDYAGKLAIRFAYASNGKGVHGIDMQTGAEGGLAGFPTPEKLWSLTFATANAWRDRFAAVPFEDRGGYFQGRYYQDIAVERVLAAIAEERHFLADRNILADQAYNAFLAFPDDALVRIAPDDIRKNGKVPKNGSIFFTIFQTFMSGDGEAPYFGEYPAGFFDFIVIDECHRGGANDEGNWRSILDYFAPAVQLGLTATPKRKDNVDTYAYFGEPVFVYSLKDGINDGYLTPFRVKQIATTLDDYVFTPDDTVVEGEIEAGKRYEEADFNRIIEIREREKKRVEIFMGQIDPREKTLVFCANQTHALVIRDLVNQIKSSSDPNYCHRVTADDGALGEQDTPHPAHDGDELLAFRWHADVGRSVHGSLVRETAGILQGRGRIAHAVEHARYAPEAARRSGGEGLRP